MRMESKMQCFDSMASDLLGNWNASDKSERIVYFSLHNALSPEAQQWAKSVNHNLRTLLLVIKSHGKTERAKPCPNHAQIIGSEIPKLRLTQSPIMTSVYDT